MCKKLILFVFIIVALVLTSEAGAADLTWEYIYEGDILPDDPLLGDNVWQLMGDNKFAEITDQEELHINDIGENHCFFLYNIADADLMQEATIEARVKVLSQTGTNFEVLVGMQDGRNSKWLDLFPDHILLDSSNSTYDVDMTEYHILRMVRNIENIRIYVDEEEVISVSHVGAGESWIGFIFGAGATLSKSEQFWDYIVFTTEGGFSPEELPTYDSREQGLARRPEPSDGALNPDTWITLSWVPGKFAVSHDIYLGEDFDDVNEATRDSKVFRGNQALGLEFFIAGFSGYPYPDGLVNGTTYYWRIDEVNDADPNSPWKGKVWSFTIPPKTAYLPNPADGAEFVPLNTQLKWTAGYGTKIHYIVFGEDFDQVSNAVACVSSGTTTYNPGPLKLAKTYYWRVDENDGVETYKGQVWSFTTEGAVSGPNPANGAVDVNPAQILTWNAGAVAASHEVYFGADADAVANATKSSPEYKGPKALGQESYDPGRLSFETTYYWRIDEVNNANPDSPWAGNVWSFTTGDFFVIDDFEDYNLVDNQIWWTWKDGLGYAEWGEMPAYPGNGTGSEVSIAEPIGPITDTEENVVHGGNQSMLFSYDNNLRDFVGVSYYSEAEKTLTEARDWTEEGVAELSLWFRGHPASVGSFVEGPAGTYTMTGSGADIWNQFDEFHYAFKVLSGAGSIIARVDSVSDTDSWAKAGVMIRETLDADSKHAMMVVTSGSGVSFQRRPETGGDSADDTNSDITAPYWVKLERNLAGTFSAYSSANGSTWQKLGMTELITMSANVYIGLAVTAHNASATCEAVFSNVTITGNISGQWTNLDVGIEHNDAEPLYIAVSNAIGEPAVVVHDNPAAAQIDTWTEWIIPLQVFADQGIALTDVYSVAIGLGTKGNKTTPGGSGKMYIDDIRLYQPRDIAVE
jgi:hypothetical protein